MKRPAGETERQENHDDAVSLLPESAFHHPSSGRRLPAPTSLLLFLSALFILTTLLFFSPSVLAEECEESDDRHTAFFPTQLSPKRILSSLMKDMEQSGTTLCGNQRGSMTLNLEGVTAFDDETPVALDGSFSAVYGAYLKPDTWVQARSDTRLARLAPDLFDGIAGSQEIRASAGIGGFEDGDFGADMRARLRLNHDKTGNILAARPAELGPAAYTDMQAEAWVWPLRYMSEPGLSWVNLPFHISWRDVHYADSDAKVYAFDTLMMGTGIFSRYHLRNLDGEMQWFSVHFGEVSINPACEDCNLRTMIDSFKDPLFSMQGYDRLDIRALSFTNIVGSLDFLRFAFDVVVGYTQLTEEDGREASGTTLDIGFQFTGDPAGVGVRAARNITHSPNASTFVSNWRLEAEFFFALSTDRRFGGRFGMAADFLADLVEKGHKDSGRMCLNAEFQYLLTDHFATGLSFRFDLDEYGDSSWRPWGAERRHLTELALTVTYRDDQIDL